MSTEEFIREFISKMCPFHGKHANVEIHEEGEINISACCAEFQEQMKKNYRLDWKNLLMLQYPEELNGPGNYVVKKHASMLTGSFIFQ